MKFHLTLFCLVLFLHNVKASSHDGQQVYIVYLGEHIGEKTFEEIENFHHSYLHAVKSSKEEAEESIIYSFKNVINGFSALLAPQEASRISEMDGVISVFHSHPTRSGLHTTRSWDFIRSLEAIGDRAQADGDDGEEVLRRASYGKNVIVGVLDTGVWPESECCNNDGMEPIPSSWKGICQSGVDFNSSHCNRKLIGARYYVKSYERWYGRLNSRQEFRSPRDSDGHGTHVSSTVCGRRVAGAAASGGYGNGTASGGAPLVRLAMYKVCWPIPSDESDGGADRYTCMDDDILAAFDDAIADGVHVISVSIGTNTSRPYTEDGIAIGALHAVKRNIVVVCSAGNSGPWIMTVGASSIDRVFSSPLVLGNGQVIEGESITPFQRGAYPLVYAASAEIQGTTTNLTNGLCRIGTLSPELVRGNVYEGVGVIGRPYPIPATVIPSNETLKVYNYTAQSEAPTATLIPTRTLIGTKPAPFMADFTSRGPSFIQPNILKVYIVYLGEHSGGKSFEEIEEIHHSYLHSVKGSKEEAKACVVYSYKNVINGFSALLTPQEAHRLSEMEGVISVFHSHPTALRLHTTRSWDFISSLEANWDASMANGEEFSSKANYGKNVIVGVLDSGVWPESESFNDDGMEPIPPSWKGVCETGVAFNSSHCNRKLVGARYYLNSYEANYGPLNPNLDYRSPRDINGHGTHTSSTIGGRRVPVGGIGNGTARGGATLARLAVYKVCWPIPPDGENYTCMDDDILAAFDNAIADGVHVISVSIAGNMSRPYTQDGISIGALHAAQHNIVVACSAGNSGPNLYTVSNVAPWIITVGASSIDRVFSSPLTLGNGLILEGQSITPFQKATYPLVYAGAVEIPGTTTNLTTGLCLNGTLSPPLVRGKAVFCWAGDTPQALEVQRAGGIATVLGNIFNGSGVTCRPYLIPATVVLSDEKRSIFDYTESDAAPTATLTPARTLLGTKPAPFMAAFSSRGPSFMEPNILKPDITAPGLNILAAWSEASSPLKVASDNRVVKFQINSGTSMSCPHVAAAAALLKELHPDWSSAAVRSALMTTAKVTNNEGNMITDAEGNTSTPFEYGSGHIQPSKAADPGLVYDASYNDYLLFLCSSSGNLLDPSFDCPVNLPSPSSLNYPSLAIANLQGSVTVVRTVTNVGVGNSSYSVAIDPPPGYVVGISPEKLYFSETGEKQSFTITVEVGSSRNEYAFGWYTWSDGIHQVRSPISVWTLL